MNHHPIHMEVCAIRAPSTSLNHGHELQCSLIVILGVSPLLVQLLGAASVYYTILNVGST